MNLQINLQLLQRQANWLANIAAELDKQRDEEYEGLANLLASLEESLTKEGGGTFEITREL